MTADRDQAAAEPRNPGEPEEKVFALLDGYWEALERGDDARPTDWIGTHPEGKDRLGDLQLVAMLHDAYAMAHEDSQAELASTREFPTGYKPVLRREFLEPGLQLGQCRIERHLGHGGMGEVYLAEHPLMKRQVAVKVVLARRAEDPGAVERFLREVELLAKMSPDPNLAAAFDAGVFEGHYYLVMEYVPGVDLKRYVEQNGPLPIAQACSFIRQAALGLEHMHKHGIVHRDIKPSNLMLTKDQSIKVLDLGLARLTVPGVSTIDPSLTPAEALLGTYDYLAPEQARDASAADARSDLYSLGCTFYELLTGKPPFDHCPNFDKLAAHARDEPPPVQQLRPEVSDAVAAVVHRLLAKKPEDRYPSGRALVEGLDGALEAGPVVKQPSVGRRMFGLSRSRSSRAIALTIAALLVLVGATALWYFVHVVDPPALDQLVVYMVKDDRRYEKYTFVNDGKERDPGPIELRSEEAFRIEARFQKPTYWYMLWFDSAGLLEIASCPARQADVQYPDPDHAQTINPTDPLGVHLLLLVASSVSPEKKGAELLANHLSGAGAINKRKEEIISVAIAAEIGRPPDMPLLPSASLLRGSGEKVPLATDSPVAYLQRIRAKLPSGFVAVWDLYLRTAK